MSCDRPSHRGPPLPRSQADWDALTLAEVAQGCLACRRRWLEHARARLYTTTDHGRVTAERMAEARARGVAVGHPWSPDAPDPEAVRALRAAGRSWAEVARALRCTPSSARRAATRGL